MESQKIKELTDKIRTELETNLTEKEVKQNINQYLTEIEELSFEEPEEEKKLWEELGISQDLEKKKVVKEVKRLAQIKGIEVNFTNDKDKIPEKMINGTITLFLNQTDNNGDFSPNLFFWNFAEQLTHFETNSSEKILGWWKELIKEQKWVKDNLNEEFQQEFSQLLNPSTFPKDKLEIDLFLKVNELGENVSVGSSFSVNKELVDKAWEIVRKKALELGIRAVVDYNTEWTITLNHEPNNKELENLMVETPLKLANELLKEERDKLPTTENFEKLSKQKKLLEHYLHSLTNEEKFKKIKEEVNEIE